jgi:hypothetical protein
MATRLEQLQQIGQQLPVANQRIASQQAAARNIQMQQQLGGMSANTGVPQAQQVGAGVTAQAGQQSLQNQQVQQQQVGEVAKLGLQQQQLENQQSLASKQMQAETESRKLDMQVSRLSADQKQQLFDNRLKFEYNKAGESYMNVRQLSDWTRLNAQNQQQYQDYVQKMDQTSSRELYSLQVASAKISQQMEEQSQQTIQSSRQATMAQLAQAKHDLDMQIQAKKNKAANTAAQWRAGGAVVGAVAGAAVAGYFSGGTATGAGYAGGAAAGAAIGQGLGEIVGSQQ